METFDEGIANKTKNPELQEKSHKTAVGARYKLISSRLQKNTTILRTTQDHFTHIKFDSANQELLHHKNRARLPQISTRGASFEVKTARQRLFRELRTPRTHMELKNVEVGVQGVMRRDDSLCDKERKRMSEPHPMEYTFYVRRSTQKFQESKFNIFW